MDEQQDKSEVPELKPEQTEQSAPPEQRSVYDVPVDLPDEGQKPDDKFKPKGWKPKKGIPKKPIIIGLAVIAALVIGVFIYKFLAKKDAPAAEQSQSQTQNQTEQPKTSDVSSAPLKEYNAENLGIKFKYPENWTVTPAQDGGLKVESPEFNYETVSKGVISGNFRVYIRVTARDVDGKYIGRGLAIAPSEPLAYSNPLSTQRKDTYLSAFGLDKTDNFNFFLIAGNFNLKKGDSLGPNFGKEAGTYIIAGGYSADDLKDDLAMNSVPTGSYNQTEAYKEAIELVKSLQLN